MNRESIYPVRMQYEKTGKFQGGTDGDKECLNEYTSETDSK